MIGTSAYESPAPDFLAPSAPYTDAETARFHLVPVPYEHTTSYQQGTALGPAAILQASAQVEFHDEQLGTSPLRAGIHTAEAFEHGGAPDVFCRDLEAAYESRCREDRVIGLLGGEHTITVAPVRSLASRHPGMGVLQIDAHADLRDSYEGSAFSHACVARRVVDVAPVVQVGIRALSRVEAEFITASDRVHTFWAHDPTPHDLADRVAAALPEKVYVTLDIDGLDPSEAPGTGTPEPGGLRYREVLAILTAVARRCTIVGFDLVEVRPLAGNTMTELLAARLVYKLIGAIATRGGTVRPAWRHPAPEEDA